LRKVFAIAPGYPFDPDKLLKACQHFAHYGIEVIVPDDLLQPFRFFSAPDEVRFQRLWESLNDPTVDAIWAIRGGYGSQRLLPFLWERLDHIKQYIKPKLLVGLSDVTSLHLFWNLILGWPSWHAPMLETMGREDFPEDKRRFWMEAFWGKAPTSSHPVRLINGNKSVVQDKIDLLRHQSGGQELLAQGPITGGNLSVLQGHIGTPVLPSLDGYFLFLEEVGERAYRIDRMLFHLKQSGLLRGVRGIIWGEVTGGEEKDGSTQWIGDVIHDWAFSLDLPVWTGYPSGHGRGYGGLVFGDTFMKLEYHASYFPECKTSESQLSTFFLEANFLLTTQFFNRPFNQS
jgi:muramoyltetrapeptide carboxypeptidase